MSNKAITIGAAVRDQREIEEKFRSAKVAQKARKKCQNEGLSRP